MSLLREKHNKPLFNDTYIIIKWINWALELEEQRTKQSHARRTPSTYSQPNRDKIPLRTNNMCVSTTLNSINFMYRPIRAPNAEFYSKT